MFNTPYIFPRPMWVRGHFLVQLLFKSDVKKRYFASFRVQGRKTINRDISRFIVVYTYVLLFMLIPGRSMVTVEEHRYISGLAG